ncbi:MAG TPA: EamA family transporter [Emcibacteraceae bacterium]|nr:EamA family transporter [Emcibacteraceae bacterium]HRW28812.1 EamA family transporter [Emcibacteraceae bacterium]
MNKSKLWLIYALITTLFWGVWGAFSGLTAGHMPDTIIYIIWALTMIFPAIFVLKMINWKLQHDSRSIFLGSVIGLLGAIGQMVLFYTLTIGPAYLIFPIIALSPMVTIILSLILLKERTTKLGAVGVVLALISLQFFEYSSGDSDNIHGFLWFFLALSISAAWGIQAYFMKISNESMNAESIFFYMMITSLLLIPLAIWMTDFSTFTDWSAYNVSIAASIQILNAIGALCLVYAFRYGKAIVVSPMTNAGAPLITAIISLVALGIIPAPTKILAIIFAVTAAMLLAIEPVDEEKNNSTGDA